ncbi:hypothetical protein B0J12DRAFT_458672, partial [Macrophomina phaseolina]
FLCAPSLQPACVGPCQCQSVPPPVCSLPCALSWPALACPARSPAPKLQVTHARRSSQPSRRRRCLTAPRHSPPRRVGQQRRQQRQYSPSRTAASLAGQLTSSTRRPLPPTCYHQHHRRRRRAPAISQRRWGPGALCLSQTHPRLSAALSALPESSSKRKACPSSPRGHCTRALGHTGPGGCGKHASPFGVTQARLCENHRALLL